MKIYVMCKSPKLSKFPVMCEIYRKAVIIGNQPMLYNLLNTLVPVAPAILDIMPGIIKQSKNIAMVIIRVL